MHVGVRGKISKIWNFENWNVSINNYQSLVSGTSRLAVIQPPEMIPSQTESCEKTVGDCDQKDGQEVALARVESVKENQSRPMKRISSKL